MDNYSNSQLEAMGLEPHRQGVDEKLRFSNWTRKAALHAAIKAQNQLDKPDTVDMWRIAGGNTVVSAVNCNMGIHIIKISAVVPGCNANGSDIALPDEFYLCKKETGVWTVKYLTAAEGSHKSNAHLRQASNPDNYSVSKYNEYVPTQVMSAINTYKELYYTKYHPNNATLTNVMMDATFTSFKCDFSMHGGGRYD